MARTDGSRGIGECRLFIKRVGAREPLHIQRGLCRGRGGRVDSEPLLRVLPRLLVAAR